MIYILFRKSSCSTSDFNFLQLTRSRLLRSTRFSLSIFGPWFRSDSTDQFADFRNNMPSALIILSEGAEEIETVVVADVLTRGKVGILHGFICFIHLFCYNIASTFHIKHAKCSQFKILFLQIDVTIAGLHGSEPVVCSRNVIIKPGASLSEVVSKTFDVIVLPGGLKGAENLAKVCLYHFISQYHGFHLSLVNTKAQ